MTRVRLGALLLALSLCRLLLRACPAPARSRARRQPVLCCCCGGRQAAFARGQTPSPSRSECRQQRQRRGVYGREGGAARVYVPEVPGSLFQVHQGACQALCVLRLHSHKVGRACMATCVTATTYSRQGGEKDGAELAHEQLPAGSTKLMQAMHAFEKAAHAVSLRHANLEHAAQLKQVGGAGAEAAQSKVLALHAP